MRSPFSPAAQPSRNAFPAARLPIHYSLTVNINFPTNTFDGDETIDLKLTKPSNTITLNAVEIDFHEVTVTAGGQTQTAKVSTDDEERDGDLHRRQASFPPGRRRCTSSTPAI